MSTDSAWVRAAAALPVGACAGEWLDGPWRLVAFLAVLGVAALPRGFALLAATVAVAFAAAPLSLANHHVVAGWYCLSWALVGDDPAARRSLYAAMMGMATLQKLLSSAFWTGSFVGWMGLTGEWARPLWRAVPPVARMVGINEGRLVAAELEPVVLVAPPGTATAALGFTWLILVVETALTWGAWRGHRGFVPLATAFVVLLPLVRDEWVFASLLAALTAFCSEAPRVRGALLVGSACYAMVGLAT